MCLLFGLLAGGLKADAVLGKSYAFARVAITAEVLPDGAMRIVEERTYDFRGAFSWASYTLDLRGSSGVSGVTVSDETGPYRLSSSHSARTYDVDAGRREMRLRWYFQAADQQKTFVISYVVNDVVTRYSDVAELYWKFIGTGWDVASEDVVITVLLPGVRRQEIRAWGHGPLHGRVEIEDNRVRMRARHLPPRAMVEGRILVPARLVSGGRIVNGARLAGIVAEETRLAAEANRLRLLHRANLLSALLVPLLAVACYLGVYLRWGREHRPRVDGEYVRDLPERYPPALLGVLWRFGTPAAADLTATIMDLARRGYLTIQEGGSPTIPGGGLVADLIRQRLKHVKTYTFVRSDKPDEDLLEFEREALHLMFKNAPDGVATSLTFAQDDGDLRKRYAAWLEQVKSAARAHGMFDEGSNRVRRGVAYASLCLGFIAPTAVLAGGPALGYEPWGAGAGLLVAGLLLLILSPHIRRRSLEGATQFGHWQSFRRFLTDFSQLKDAPPPAIAIWEHYLPYAVTLGVAQEVLRQLPIVYGTQAHASPSWFASDSGAGNGGVGHFAASLASMTSSVSAMVAGAVSPSSGGDGSGGGFSGGDGGGGGGGGSGGSAG